MRQWFTMKADDKSAEIVIYDEIGKSFWNEEAVSAKSFLDDLNALGEVETITLRINSPGGDIFDGVAIHNAIKNHKAKVTAHVDGIAASAASYIAMAANKIVMPANAFMLIHGASGFVFGNADDMRGVAADLDRVDKSITATYVARSKSTTAKIKAIMKEDRLMDAAEAKELGLADEVAKEVKMAAKFSLRLLSPVVADQVHAALFNVAETGTAQEDPPPTAAKPESPESSPPTVPDSPFIEASVSPTATEVVNPPMAEVVDLNAAKQTGIDEHKAYVSAVTDLCTLASAPEKVGSYVRASTPIDQVRKELLELRAAADVLPHHPLAPKPPPENAWGKITEKLNARVKQK
jgi:ATP-dependent Clp protease, protease subunit